MKKTFTTLKSLAVAAALLVASNAQAQVVYTDVTPDHTVTQSADGLDMYNVDMNNDGTNDFIVNIAKITGEPVPGGTADIFTIEVDTYDDASGSGISVVDLTDELAVAYSNGDQIGSSATWDSEYGTLYDNGTFYPTAGGSFPGTEGNFDNSTGKYVGVQFVVGADTYYGYLAINTTSNSYTLTGFAYESTPGTAIAAGATGTTAVSSALKANTTIYTVNNAIVADFKNAFVGQMDVVNMNGVVVKSVAVNGTSATVAMEGAQSGIYQVVLSGAEGFASDKVVIVN